MNDPKQLISDVLSIYDVNLETGIITHRLSRGGMVAGSEAGCTNQDGYRRIRVGNKLFVVHRIIWLLATGGWPKDQIDHENGIRKDNRISNLREANNSQNQQNKLTKSNGKTGLQGVSLLPNGRYKARIKADRRYISLGSYDTAESAHQAYLQGKKIYHPFSPNLRS